MKKHFLTTLLLAISLAATAQREEKITTTDSTGCVQAAIYPPESMAVLIIENPSTGVQDYHCIQGALRVERDWARVWYFQDSIIIFKDGRIKAVFEGKEVL